MAKTDPGDETPDQSIEQILSASAALIVPFAKMYLGPSLAAMGREKATDAMVLQYAFSKLVLEAGRLPATSSAYEPHSQAFSIDDQGYAPSLDLPFVLGALRATSAWLGASPMRAMNATTTAVKTDANAAANPSADLATASMSAREMRSTIRARSYAAVAPERPAVASVPGRAVTATPVRGGGCGCRGGATGYTARPAPSSFTRAVSATSKRAAARDRMVGCGTPKLCGCGGGTSTGCGCSGRTSCVDCIPRGISAGDECTCGGCAPPEDCRPWTPSCRARNRLRDCLKELVCDLLACIEAVVCAAQLGGEAARLARANFRRCLADLICKLMRCFREAICPPPCPPQLPVPNDCVPCDFAVEGL